MTKLCIYQHFIWYCPCNKACYYNFSLSMPIGGEEGVQRVCRGWRSKEELRVGGGDRRW